MGNPGWVLPPGIGARHGFPVYRFAAKPNKAAIDAFWGRCDAIIAEWKKDHMEAMVVQCLKALHQVALDQGDWANATMLVPTPDLPERTSPVCVSASA